MEILKFDRKKENSLSRKYSDVLAIVLSSKWQLSKLIVNKYYLEPRSITRVGIQVCFAHASNFIGINWS